VREHADLTAATAGEGHGTPSPMPEPRRAVGVAALSLRKNFSWITAGRIVYAITQWAMLAILAKLASAASVGELSLALAVSLPIFKFSNLGLRHAQATDVGGDHGFRDYLGLRIVTSLLSVFAIAGIGAGLGHGLETTLVIVLVGLMRGLASIGEVFHACFQLYERMDHVARSLVLRGVLSVALLAVGVIVGGQLWIGAFGMAVASLAVLGVHDLRRGRRLLLHRAGEAERPIAPRFERARLWRLTKQTLPLGVAGALFSLQQSTPRFFLAQGIGLEELGYFAAMAYIANAGNELVQGFGHSAVARLARAYAEGRTADFARLLGKVSLIGLVFGGLGLGVALAAGELTLTLLYASDYAVHADVFVWVMLAALLRYVASLLHFGTTAARRFRAHLVNHLAVALVALGASLWWIPSHGILGAAWAMLAAAAADLACAAAINLLSIRACDRSAGSFPP